jgi:hypothetical protein
MRRYRRVSRARKRRLERPREALRSARRTLATIDRELLLEVETKPLLDDSGPAEDARAVARSERRYLRAAGTTLERYDEVLAFFRALVRVDDRLIATVVRGGAAVPRGTVYDPGQLTRPLDRLARRLIRVRRSYRRLESPPALRRYRAKFSRLATVVIQEVRRASAAFSRFDNAGAQAAFKRLDRRIDRVGRSDQLLLRLFTASALSERFDDLDDRDRRIRRAYAAL